MNWLNKRTCKNETHLSETRFAALYSLPKIVSNSTPRTLQHGLEAVFHHYYYYYDYYYYY